jgi:hypothetical protein
MKSSGRKFAEQRGLENAERIENGFPGRTFFSYDFDSYRVNNLSPAPLLDLSVSLLVGQLVYG